MKTLEQIQDEYAKEQGYKNWEGLLFSFQYTRIMKIDELIKHQNAVIQIVQDELKKKIADNLMYFENSEIISSILNTENIK